MDRKNGNSDFSGGKKPYNKSYNKNHNNSNRPQRRRTEDLEDVIERRNERLKKFFEEMRFDVRIIGDKNSPAIIFEDKWILNAYVHNFELRFTDNPYEGNVIYVVKLSENPIYDKKAVEDCIYEYDLRLAHKVKLLKTDIDLYLSGYNFQDKEQRTGRYPVFSLHHPKVYFTKEKAEEVIAELEKMGYPVTLA